MNEVQKVEVTLVQKDTYEAALHALQLYLQELQENFQYVQDFSGEPELMNALRIQINVVSQIRDGFKLAVLDQQNVTPGRGFH